MFRNLKLDYPLADTPRSSKKYVLCMKRLEVWQHESTVNLNTNDSVGDHSTDLELQQAIPGSAQEDIRLRSKQEDYCKGGVEASLVQRACYGRRNRSCCLAREEGNGARRGTESEKEWLLRVTPCPRLSDLSLLWTATASVMTRRHSEHNCSTLFEPAPVLYTVLNARWLCFLLSLYGTCALLLYDDLKGFYEVNPRLCLG